MSQHVPFHFSSGQPAPYSQTHQQTFNPQVPAPTDLSQQMSTMQNDAQLGFNHPSLKNITPEQLAEIARLFELGQLPIPPPKTSQNVSTGDSATQPSSSQPANISSANGNIAKDVDMDVEEGELEEGEVGDAPSFREFRRTPPRGPRYRSRSPRPRFPDSQNGRRSSLQSQPTHTRPGLPSRKPSAMNNSTNGTRVNGDPKSSHGWGKDELKTFLVEMSKAGYTFEQVAKEVRNVPGLRHFYEQLQIPLAQQNGAAKPTSALTQPPQDQRKTSLTKRPAPAKAAPALDRTAYLAKLQAAKNKKPEQAAPTPPKGTESPLDATKLVASPPQLPQEAPTDDGPSSDAQAAAKRNRMNDVIKQKMEALKAQQAARKTSDSLAVQQESANMQSPSTSRMGLGDGLVEAAARAADVGATSTTAPSNYGNHTQPLATMHQAPQTQSPMSSSPALSRGFLPGLFTTTPSMGAPLPQRSASAMAYPNQITQPLPAPFVAPRPRAIHSDSYNSNGAGTYTPSHSYNTAQEAFIIQDSDEESRDDMDIDEDAQNHAPAEFDQEAVRRTDSLRWVSTKHEAQKSHGASAPGTPGTPNDAYKRKMEEIEKAKLLIAEKEKLKKAERAAERARGKLAQVGKEAPPAEVENAATSSVSQFATPVAVSTSTPVAAPLPVDQVTTEPFKAIDISYPSTEPPPLMVAGSSTLEDSSRNKMEALRMQLEAAKQSIKANGSGRAGATFGNSPSQDMSTKAQEVADNSASSEPADVIRASRDDIGGHETANDSGEFVDLVSSDEDEAMYAVDTADNTGMVEVQASAVNTQPIDRPSESASPSEDDDEALYEQAVAEDDEVQVLHSEVLLPRVDANLPFETAIDEEYDDDDDDMDDLYEQDEMQPTTSLSTGTEQPVDNDLEEYQDQCTDDAAGEDAMETSDDSETNSEEESEQSVVDEILQPEPEPETAQIECAFGVDITLPPSDTNENTVTEESGSPVVANDIAPELQPSREELAVPNEKLRTTSRYEEYESPLARFKDFRYHPDYLKEVSSGFKSLTYSHKIDSINTLCPWEAAGGECHDKACHHQHFHDMALTDNDLLRSMGAENVPVSNPDEDKRWKLGLAGVVQELRNTNQGKDVTAIARRIAEYRREFRGDPTKTLLLD